MSPRVLITEAQSRAGLAAVRSLGRHGIGVTAADQDRLALGFFSRYCERRLRYPNPVQATGHYVDVILRELQRQPYDVLMPLFDNCVRPLAQRREEVEQMTRFPYSNHDALLHASDKAVAIKLAHQHGLRTPVTIEACGPEDVDRALLQFPLPVIVRPRLAGGSNGLHRIWRKEHIWPTCQQLTARFGPVIIQEYIPWGGLTYDVDVLMNRDSLPRALVVCKRLRTFPALAGPTACGQATYWPELADMATGLLRSLQWYGPAEVEFRIDPRDGRPVFMEINARLWGSLYTGMVAGVDFPYLLYRMAVDDDIAPVTTYRTDMKARYLFTLDLLCMATHPHKRSIARQWFADFFDPHTKMLIPSWRDPLPLAGKLIASLVYGVRPSRLRQRLGRVKNESPA